MKFSLPEFVMSIALMSAHAQTDASANAMLTKTPKYCALVDVGATSSDDLTSADLLLAYVENVEGLLRDLADRMRSISEQVEAGELTPLQAQAMKLETARGMIGRLETISAVYEAVIFPREDPDVPRDDSSEAPHRVGLQTNLTVSVDDLLRETAQ